MLVMREAPRRIQRLRAKGWRMPPSAVYVGRPTRWGNPFRLLNEEGWPLIVDEAWRYGARLARSVVGGS